MLSLPDASAIRAALNQPLDHQLHDILADKLACIEAHQLESLTYILVVQPGDTEEGIEQELGWSPLVNPIDGTRCGTADFLPYWAWLQATDGYWEIIETVGDAGFAYIILVEDDPATPTELLDMCRTYAGEAS